MSKCLKNGKKSAKLVRGCDGVTRCVRYGDPNMTIKKNIAGRRRSFCARHRCHMKSDPATPGYQSCRAWNCSVASRCSGKRIKRKSTNVRKKAFTSRKNVSKRSYKRNKKTKTLRKKRTIRSRRYKRKTQKK